MKIKKLWNNIDKKRFKIVSIITIIFLVLVISTNIIGITYTRYESSAQVQINSKVAYFVAETAIINDTISLDGLTPRSEPFLYEIRVNNFKDSRKANVNIKYNITFQTTTNLPLTYEVLYNEDYSSSRTNIVSSEEFIQEGDMYFKKLNINKENILDYHNKQSDRYILVINFPKLYENNPEYAGVIDLITININAEQVV